MRTHYETKRLHLHVLTPDFCELVLHFYEKNRTFFAPYEPICPDSYYTNSYQYNTLLAEQQMFLEQKNVRFYLFEKEDPETIIGTISFSNITHGFFKSAITGYKLDARFQHQGYAFEAMQKGIEIMFYELKLHRLTAYIMKNNLPSIRLIEKLYFSYEGIATEYALIHGKWEDHLQYALINHL